MATQPVVQYFPPAPAAYGSAFDTYQFAGRRLRAVSSETRIAYSDFVRMRIHRRSSSRSRRWVPTFANNTAQLRYVIMQRCWNYLQSHGLIPPDLSWEALKKRVDRHFARLAAIEFGEPESTQWKIHEQHKLAVYRAGGYMEMIAALAYRSFCLGQESPRIGEQMHMTPQAVRAQVYRLNLAAERFGYETHPPHKSRGMKQPGRAGGISSTVEPRKLKFQLEKWHFENRVARRRAQPNPGNGTVSKKVLSGFDALKYLRRA